jgi:hypothetical protein
MQTNFLWFQRKKSVVSVETPGPAPCIKVQYQCNFCYVSWSSVLPASFQFTIHGRELLEYPRIDRRKVLKLTLKEVVCDGPEIGSSLGNESSEIFLTNWVSFGFSWKTLLHVIIVKLIQSGITRDQIYFPHWPSFRIVQNFDKKKLNPLKSYYLVHTCLWVKIGGAGSFT